VAVTCGPPCTGAGRTRWLAIRRAGTQGRRCWSLAGGSWSIGMAPLPHGGSAPRPRGCLGRSSLWSPVLWCDEAARGCSAAPLKWAAAQREHHLGAIWSNPWLPRRAGAGPGRGSSGQSAASADGAAAGPAAGGGCAGLAGGTVGVKAAAALVGVARTRHRRYQARPRCVRGSALARPPMWVRCRQAAAACLCGGPRRAVCAPAPCLGTPQRASSLGAVGCHAARCFSVAPLGGMAQQGCHLQRAVGSTPRLPRAPGGVPTGGGQLT